MSDESTQISRAIEARRERRRQMHIDRQLLAAEFPDLFTKPGSSAPKKPLKTGIEIDLIQALGARGKGVPMGRIQDAVKDYTSGRRYCEAIAQGGARFGLDGLAYGSVSASARERAAARLEEEGWT